MAAKKESSAIPQKNLDDYNKLVATNPKIESKGLTVPYTSCNGHMFSYLEKDGSLGLRLPPDMLEEFLKKYKTTLFKSYGIIKKEYALVPDKLLKNTKELKPYFDASYKYVLSLKPKPGKKSK
jgi:hypothetical protein